MRGAASVAATAAVCWAFSSVYLQHRQLTMDGSKWASLFKDGKDSKINARTDSLISSTSVNPSTEHQQDNPQSSEPAETPSPSAPTAPRFNSSWSFRSRCALFKQYTPEDKRWISGKSWRKPHTPAHGSYSSPSGPQNNFDYLRHSSRRSSNRNKTRSSPDEDSSPSMATTLSSGPGDTRRNVSSPRPKGRGMFRECC